MVSGPRRQQSKDSSKRLEGLVKWFRDAVLQRNLAAPFAARDVPVDWFVRLRTDLLAQITNLSRRGLKIAVKPRHRDADPARSSNSAKNHVRDHVDLGHGFVPRLCGALLFSGLHASPAIDP